MSQNLYILPPDSLTMVTAVFAGLGILISIIFVILTVLQTKSAICKPPGKGDLEKLNTIEGLQLIKEDSESTTHVGKSTIERKPKKKAKKEAWS